MTEIPAHKTTAIGKLHRAVNTGLNAEITSHEALALITALAASPARAAEPRMWFVKDFADGWIAFNNETDAKREAEHTGAMMLSGYLTPTT